MTDCDICGRNMINYYNIYETFHGRQFSIDVCNSCFKRYSEPVNIDICEPDVGEIWLTHIFHDEVYVVRTSGRAAYCIDYGLHSGHWYPYYALSRHIGYWSWGPLGLWKNKKYL